MLRVALVINAEVLVNLSARGAVVVVRLPRHGPASAPRFRVRALVVDRDFVFHGVEVSARETLRQVQKPRVWQPAADHPELLAETDAVDDERVAFPTTDRIAE